MEQVEHPERALEILITLVMEILLGHDRVEEVQGAEEEISLEAEEDSAV